MDTSAGLDAPHRVPGPSRRLPSTTRWPAPVAAVSLLLFLAVLVAVQARWAPLLSVDDAARDLTDRVSYRAPLLVDALRTVSRLGTSAAYAALLAVLAAVLVRRGRARTAVWSALTVLGGALLNTAVKSVVHRTRPVLVHPVAHATFSSFPSGHAQGVVVATGVLLVVLRAGRAHHRRAAEVVVAVVWVLLMGASRVGLGVHFLSDVVAGYLLGAAWLSAAVLVGGRWGGVRTR